MTKTKSNIKLVTSHDYITVKTPNGNYTVNRRGAKASGKMCDAFDKVDKWVANQMKVDGATNMTVMTKLTDEKVMTELFPEWNKAIPTFTIDQPVTLTHELFLKKYPTPGIVSSIKRTNVFIEFPDGQTIGFPMNYVVGV